MQYSQRSEPCTPRHNSGSFLAVPETILEKADEQSPPRNGGQQRFGLVLLPVTTFFVLIVHPGVEVDSLVLQPISNSSNLV